MTPNFIARLPDHKRYVYFLLVFLLFIGGQCHSETVLAGIPLDREAVFKQVRIPLGEENAVQPSLVLEIQKITVQPRKFDFLQISAIPQPVLDGICIKVMDRANPQSSLRYLQEFSRNNPAFQNGRLLNVSFLDAKGQMIVSAKEGFMRRVGSEILLRRVNLTSLSSQTEIPEGTIKLVGSEAGLFVWRDILGKTFSAWLFPTLL